MKDMKHFKYLAAILVSSLSFTAQSKELLDINELPNWFVDAYKQEKAVHKRSILSVDELQLNGTVKGDITLVDDSDGTWYFTIDIGTDTPMECYIFTSFDGTSNSLNSIVNYSVKGAAEANNMALVNQFNLATDTGVIGQTPYLAFDKLYQVQGDELLVGVIKGISAKTDDTLQICVHNEIGYRDTFLTVFESFINVFNQSKTDDAFFQPIYRLLLNGTPVGFAKEGFTKDQDGDVEISSEFAMLVPVNANTASTTDTIENSWSRPDGTLINGTKFSVENGELTSHFSLAKKDGKWFSEGELQGKEVAAELTYTDTLYSSYGNYTETAKLQQSENKSSEYHMWIADASPLEVTKVSMSKVENDPNGNVKINMGPINLNLMSDDFGVFPNATMSQGPVKLTMELMYLKGSPSAL